MLQNTITLLWETLKHTKKTCFCCSPTKLKKQCVINHKITVIEIVFLRYSEDISPEKHHKNHMLTWANSFMAQSITRTNIFFSVKIKNKKSKICFY